MNRINYKLKAKHRTSGKVVELSSEEVKKLLATALNLRFQTQFVVIQGIEGIYWALLLGPEGGKQRIRILEYNSDAYRFRFGCECLVNKANIGRTIKFVQCHCEQDCYLMDDTVEHIVSLECNYKNPSK